MDEPYFMNPEEKKIVGSIYGDKQTQVERSLIHPEYARRFIREYIL